MFLASLLTRFFYIEPVTTGQTCDVSKIDEGCTGTGVRYFRVRRAMFQVQTCDIRDMRAIFQGQACDVSRTDVRCQGQASYV
jgi:hypothetical protein